MSVKQFRLVIIILLGCQKFNYVFAEASKVSLSVRTQSISEKAATSNDKILFDCFIRGHGSRRTGF